MSLPINTLIAVTNAIILILGAVITLTARKAYIRSGSPAMKTFAIGFGIITTGAIMGGIVHHLLSLSISQSILIQSSLTALGFVFLWISLNTADTIQLANT